MQLHDRHLIVVALITGQNFPEKPGYQIVCEAKFNNEVLSTDPVAHSTQPIFEQELAWEIEKASLRQHRLQRSALKLQFIIVDVKSPVKESIGFCILDLRSCSFSKDYKWYRLLHSKYKCSPMVFCGLYFDSDGHNMAPDTKVRSGFALTLSASDLIPRISGTDSSDESKPPDWKSTKGTSDGVWHTLGPRRLSKHPFILSLSLLHASGVAGLVPTEQELSLEGLPGFYFAFDLLGTSVTSKRFDGLANNEFFAEDYTFYVRSTVPILQAYFSQISPLSIELHYGTHCLAKALIPVTRLVHSSESNLSQPSILEGTFELVGTTTARNPLATLHVDDRPCLTLRISLQSLLHMENVPSVREDIVKSDFSQRRSISPKRNPTIKSASQQCLPEFDVLNIPDPINGNNQVELTHNSESNTVLVPTQDMLKMGNRDTEEPLHRFTYTIELRTLKNLHAHEHDPLLYARYVYPLFGSAAPVMTVPPVRIARNQEVMLPEGFCSFDFAATRKELHQRLNQAPVLVEFFDRSQGLANIDLLFGVTKIDLTTVFDVAFQSDSTPGDIVSQRFDGIGEILPVSEDPRSETTDRNAVGLLSYGLSLQDHGVFTNKLNDSSPQTRTPKDKNPVESKGINKDFEAIRTTPEYRVALDLELWRAAEEAKFVSGLQQREQQLMTTLAEEWHKRDNQRETVCRKKLAEYQSLEDKLRQTLAELANRERQLEAGEVELARLREESLRELDICRNELKQQTALKVKELDIQLQALKRQKDYWEDQADEWQQRYRAKDQEVTSITAQIAKSGTNQSTQKPDCSDRPQIREDNSALLVSRYQLEAAQLSAQLVTVTANLKQTEKRLDEVQKGRQRYRQLWTQTLHEVARLRRESETNVRHALATKETELENLRNRLLGQNEIAQQVDKSNVPQKKNQPEALDYGQEIIRLIEERDGLIMTGLYGTDDPIIVNLERHIEELIERK